MSQISSQYILSPTVASTFATDAGNAVPALNTITIAGGTNIGTSGAGSTVTINLDPTITLTGVNATTFDTNVAAAGVTLAGTTLSADGTDANIDINVTPKGTGDFKLTLGDISIDTGNLVLPNANGTATQGVIYIAGPYDLLGGGVRMHTYGHSFATPPNFFCGRGAGNFTNVGSGNIGIGENALSGLGSADYCVAIGLNAGRLNSAGNSNVFIGYSAGGSATGGSNTVLGSSAFAGVAPSGNYNTVLGYSAASNYVGAESSNIIIGNPGTATTDSHVIRIGTQGNGDNQQNKTFIAGIYNTAVGATAGVAIVDSTHQIGTLSGTTGQVLQGGIKPAWSTATYPSTVALGDVLCASAANVVGVIAAASATTGWVLTANNTAAPTFQALPPGGLSWSVKTVDLNPMVVQEGYIANKAGLLTFTLPTTCAVGKSMRVTGMNTDIGWRIAQNASQIIHFGTSATTTGIAGYLESTKMHDSVELVCCVADLEFIVVSSLGNVTLV